MLKVNLLAEQDIDSANIGQKISIFFTKNDFIQIAKSQHGRDIAIY